MESNFKIRASAAGQIMTDGVGKSNTEKIAEARQKIVDTQAKLMALSEKAVKMSEKYQGMIAGYDQTIKDCEAQLSLGIDKELSKTCTSYLMQWWIEATTGRRKDISSKYLYKGIAVEDDAILQLALQDESFHTKNEKRYENEWFTGTPDIITDTKVIDIKSSWDIFTFTEAKLSPINQNYYLQLQVYMDLVGRDEAELVYCLLNSPDEVYNNEVRKAEWVTGMQVPLTDEKLRQIHLNHHYDDLPYESRFKRFSIQRDQEVIDAIKSRVEQCRKFISNNFSNII